MEDRTGVPGGPLEALRATVDAAERARHAVALWAADERPAAEERLGLDAGSFAEVVDDPAYAARLDVLTAAAEAKAAAERALAAWVSGGAA